MPSQTQLNENSGSFRRIVRRYYNRFYDGPSIFNYPGRKIIGYRSPTVIAWIWIKSWALSWLTAAGRILFAVAFMVGLTGMMSDLMPIYYLSFLLLGIYIVDLIAGRIFRPKLILKRNVPSTATAGIPFKATYTISATSNAPAWGIHVDTVLPPLHMRFTDAGILLESPPEKELELTRTLVAARRGRYHLPLAVADSAFPFGLWRAGSRAPANAPILVLPAFRPLDQMRLPTAAGQARGGESTTNAIGQSLNFLSCREYRYGDNPRHLHGPAWARLGTPIVKEYSDERALSTGILLDLRIPSPNFVQYLERELLGHANHRFEALMSLVAAIADYIIREGSPISVYIPHMQPDPIVLNGSDPLRELLSILAVLEPARSAAGMDLPLSTRAELRNLSGIISISGQADDSWHALNTELPKVQGALIPISVSETPAKVEAQSVQLKTTDILAGTVSAIG